MFKPTLIWVMIVALCCLLPHDQALIVAGLLTLAGALNRQLLATALALASAVFLLVSPAAATPAAVDVMAGMMIAGSFLAVTRIRI